MHVLNQRVRCEGIGDGHSVRGLCVNRAEKSRPRTERSESPESRVDEGLPNPLTPTLRHDREWAKRVPPNRAVFRPRW